MSSTDPAMLELQYRASAIAWQDDAMVALRHNNLSAAQGYLSLSRQCKVKADELMSASN